MRGESDTASQSPILRPQFCLSFVTRQEDIHGRVKRASVPWRC